MAYQRESWRRFIDIILSEIPVFVTKYPLNSQIILNDFFNTIKYHEKVAFDRKNLSIKLNAFNEKYYRSDEYIKTKFLWFAIEYLKNANRLLSITEFHADTFYHYLTAYLRGNSDIIGIFQLIKETAPLNDSRWENLQYSCSKLQFSLSSEQTLFLDSLYELASRNELKFFDLKRLKYSIESEIKSSNISRTLPNLLMQLEDRWAYWMSPTAFGLTNVYANFLLNNSLQLENIIDFKNPENKILRNSHVFQFRRSPDQYAGIFIVPTYTVDLLIKHFNKCEHAGKIVINELNTITNIHYSSSLNQYRSNKGWYDLSKTELGRLAQKLKTEQPRKERAKKVPFFLTTQFAKHWNYHNFPDPIQMIKFYCKFTPSFSFQDLNSENEPLLHQSNEELQTAKFLYKNNIIQLNLLFTRLIFEYSIDQYLIEVPLMTLKQLSRLLTYLPWAEIFFTSRNIQLMTYLTTKIFKWIEDDLLWTVNNIIESNVPILPNISWFNDDTLKWDIPQILKKEIL